jgi:hypothetical protein
MGKNDRRFVKRKTRRLYVAIDRNIQTVLDIKAVFEDTHPEHAVLLTGIARAFLTVQKLLEKFYVLTWGHEPKDWYADV